MELTSDLIAVQGLLISKVKYNGDFTKILYKGGNEMKITTIINQLEQYLSSKDYLKNRIYNKTYRKELEHISFFLMINSHFKTNVKSEDSNYDHLIGIIPTLSQCLLSNVIVELGLVEPYCDALVLISIEKWETLLEEMLKCVQKCQPELAINYTYVIIKTIIDKVGTVDIETTQVSESVNSLEDIVKQLLLNCSNIALDEAKKLKKSKIYELMGLSFLTLLRLLQCCHVENPILFNIISNLISITSTIMTGVTLDVYCQWAEVDYNDSSLQPLIGEEAHRVMEMYMKFEYAKELTQMLALIAKKPLTIDKQIQEADTPKIIRKISEDSKNRDKWFKALINTDVFLNSAALECLNENCHLCELEDLTYLLNKLVHHKTEENINIFLKCATMLNTSDLKALLIRFYHNHGIKNKLGGGDKVIDELIMILNKSDVNSQNLSQHIVLYLFREPNKVLKHLYKECVKSSLVTECLKQTYKDIEDFIEIEGLFLAVLIEILEEKELNVDSVENYKTLFYVICHNGSVSKKIINGILKPSCAKHLENNEFESLRLMFTLYMSVISNCSDEEVRTLLEFSCNVLEGCRWKIFEFSYVKVELCQLAADFLITHRNFASFPKGTCKYPMNSYYIDNTQTEEDFLKSFIPNFQHGEHKKVRFWLLKMFPLCLPSEMLQIIKHLSQKLNVINVLEPFTEVLILISELVKTLPEENAQSIYNGTKYCIQNFASIIKTVFVSLNEEEINVNIAKQVCKLIEHLPENLVDVEGMSLTSIIPESALKQLAKDKEFIERIKNLKYSKIAVSIVRKMVY